MKLITIIQYFLIPFTLFATTLIPSASAIDITSNPDLTSRLKLATTNLDRNSILQPQDWVYDFNIAKPALDDAWRPGSVKNANAATFPALAGMGMTLAQLNLGPCAMLPPHFHPRATNLVVAITGNTSTFMVNENGAGLVKTDLGPGMMTIFPKGSLHSMQNNGCENAYLISALNSEDTGTLNVLNGLWKMPREMVRAAFGNDAPATDSDFKIDDLGRGVPDIGTGSVMGSKACMDLCRLSEGGKKGDVGGGGGDDEGKGKGKGKGRGRRRRGM